MTNHDDYFFSRLLYNMIMNCLLETFNSIKYACRFLHYIDNENVSVTGKLVDGIVVLQ